MKKKYRLLKNEEFKKVLDQKASVSRENSRVFYKNNGLGYSRVGISVSSKIGNSVVRHKVKRQITEIVNLCINLDDSVDYVIIAKSSYLNLNYEENLKIIKGIFESISKKGKKIDEKQENI